MLTKWLKAWNWENLWLIKWQIYLVMSKSSGFHKKNDKQIIKKLQTSFFTINFWKKNIWKIHFNDLYDYLEDTLPSKHQSRICSNDLCISQLLSVLCGCICSKKVYILLLLLVTFIVLLLLFILLGARQSFEFF